MWSALRLGLVATLALAVGLRSADAATPPRLSHRVWVLDALPPPADLEALKAVGVTGLVIPVGRLELGDESSSLTLAPIPEAARLAGWSVTALVWVHATGEGGGDADGFVTQLAPVERSLPGGSGLLLVARQLTEGVPGFATAVARTLGRTVELAAPVGDLKATMPGEGWEGVRPVAVALGGPERLGFPAAVRQDDLMALEALSERPVEFRVAIPVASRATPAAGPGGASLTAIAAAGAARYRPGARGDVFRLERQLDWGGTVLATGTDVELELYDTVRYNRDVTDVLRPARPGFVGLDTFSLPPPEPALGMSRMALVDYLAGGGPYPRPTVMTTWSGQFLHVELVNPGPHASAPATTGNWIEVELGSAEVVDVSYGDFTGAEYGRWEKGVFRSSIAREASVVRFYLTVVAPYGRVTGGALKFQGARPGGLRVRWGMRVGDGSDVVGPWRVTP